MADEETVDKHLAAVIDEVISAIQETKQAVWSASTSDRRRQLNELKTFLGEQLVALSDAEARIGGRAATMTSPTGHAIRNLRSEAGGDFSAFRALVLAELRAVAADARARADAISGAPEAELLTRLGDGLDHRLDVLTPDD
ncbi:MAG TPA: hypothetical protein VMZ73_07420 [Acidimicrobiales bacterium]|nr:hypothetical protein [Acidimicrobiales bacterium]